MFDGDDFGDRAVADDHAAGVDPEMPWCVADLVRQREDIGRDGVFLVGGDLRDRAPAVDLFGPGVLLADRVAQGFGHVPDGGAGAVGDDVRDLGGVTAAVLGVDVLDGFFAAVGLDVDVDVGRTVAFGGEEPFEQQAPFDGVGVGDAEGVADRGVRGGAAALGEDVALAAELHDVPHHQEISREVQLLDDRQLMVELGVGLRVRVAGTVAAGGALRDQVAEPGDLRMARRNRERRQFRRDQLQVERALQPQQRRALDGAGVAVEAAAHLRTRAHERRRRRREPPVQLLQ